MYPNLNFNKRQAQNKSQHGSFSLVRCLISPSGQCTVNLHQERVTYLDTAIFYVLTEKQVLCALVCKYAEESLIRHWSLCAVAACAVCCSQWHCGL